VVPCPADPSAAGKVGIVGHDSGKHILPFNDDPWNFPFNPSGADTIPALEAAHAMTIHAQI
jgi:hypothetical protein